MRRKSLAFWVRGIEKLFPCGVPVTYTWTHPERMIQVLDELAERTGNGTHYFFPYGGGADLAGVDKGTEPRTVALAWSNGSVDLVRPTELTFCSFDLPLEWAYFLLKTIPLEPSRESGKARYSQAQYEDVLEIRPREYINRAHYDSGYFLDEEGRDVPLPASARLVTRYFGGVFVFFAKGSVYNWLPETYHGPQNQMSSEEFRKFVRNLADEYPHAPPFPIRRRR